jgi:hypothetical protein
MQGDLWQRYFVTDGRIGQADQRVGVGDAERLGRASVQGHGESIDQGAANRLRPVGVMQ